MNIIKSVITIQTIMTTRLFCGFYYTISSNKLVNVLVRAYCVFIASLLILLDFMVIIYHPLLTKVRFGILIISYIPNVFISLLYSGENLYDFLKKIREFTPRLKLNEEIPLSRISFIFLLLGKVITYVLYGIINFNGFYGASAATLALIFHIAQYTSNFTRIIMFELMWQRMTMLRKQLEGDLSVARRFEEGEQVMKKKLRSCMITYKDLLNTTRVTDAPMKFMIFSSIVLLIPKMLTTIYLVIYYKIEYYSAIFIVYDALMEFIVTMSPALLAEMVNSEIDKMKTCVVKQLLVCRGEMTRDAMDDAMIFFRHRPFKYTIWRLFSVDIRLILSVIAMITTYTVAMVQFAHFYD